VGGVAASRMFTACDCQYFFTAFLDESIRHRGILAAVKGATQNACSFRSRILFRTLLTKSLAGLALTAASSQAALAADWQYCVAPAHAEHKVYMSATFPVHGALGDADDAFERMLDKAGLRHDDVQCPRADDERLIVLMQQYAISFNQENGNTIVHLPFEKAR
jgi:hypothetical protein